MRVLQTSIWFLDIHFIEVDLSWQSRPWIYIRSCLDLPFLQLNLSWRSQTRTSTWCFSLQLDLSWRSRTWRSIGPCLDLPFLQLNLSWQSQTWTFIWIFDLESDLSRRSCTTMNFYTRITYWPTILSIGSLKMIVKTNIHMMFGLQSNL